MKKGLKFLTILGLCGLAGALAACTEGAAPTDVPSTGEATESEGTSTKPSTKPTEDGKIDYSVTVKTISGKPVKNAFVTFTSGDDENQVITDETGVAVFHAPKGVYNVLVETPEGYNLSLNEAETDIIGTPLEFVCETETIPTLADKDTKYKLYDIMHDFTLVDNEGREVTLSEVLTRKNTVILNFWYSGCSNCLDEFPHIEEAYKAVSSNGVPYSDDVEFIAVNPVLAGGSDPEDQKFVAEFKKNWANGAGLSFEMLTDYNAANGGQYKPGSDYLPALNSFFNVTGYPTTIVIDRYASIANIIQGGIPDTEKWKGLFETYIRPDYKPTYSFDDIENQEGFVKNKVEHPDYTKFNDAISGTSYNNERFNAIYSKETNVNDEPYAWPWLIGEDGNTIVPSNLGVDRSYATIYVEVALKKDEVFTFDILHNIELEKDVLFVIVDDVPVAQITGNSKETITKFAYPAAYDDTYRIGFLYMKDILSSAPNEKLALSNFRIESSVVYDEDTYIFREASSGEYSDYLSKYEHYAVPVFNETDNYFHVGTKDGPLLMANLLLSSHFNPANSLYQMVASPNPEDAFIIDGVDYGKLIADYAVYASDSKVGYVPVTKELRNALEKIVHKVGKEEAKDNENQWLELCVYYDVYGPTKVQMPSPIKGLAPWEALSFEPGKTTLDVYYDRVITNRGYLVEFKPEVSGVYRFRSTVNPLTGGTNLIICDDKLNIIGINDRYTREQAIIFDLFRMDDPVDYEFDESANFIAYFYFDSSKTYYLRPHYIEQLSDVTLSFGYELMADMNQILTAASDETFTTDIENPEEAEGDIEEHIISRNYVDVDVDNDGFYYVVGSKAPDKYVYFDAKQSLSVLGTVFYKDLFHPTDENGNELPSAFDFTVDERGRKRVNDKGEVLATEKDKDGFDMIDKDGYVIYSNKPKLDRYGNPYIVRDCTDEVKVKVENNIIKSNDLQMDGLVKVDRELAEILQMLMDKYTFMGVEESWLKLCFYQQYLGPENK